MRMFTLALLLAFVLFCIPVKAENAEDEISDKLSEAAGDVAEASESPIAEALASGGTEEKGKLLLEFLSPTEILEEIFGIAADASGRAVSLLLAVGGLVMISAVCHAVGSSVGTGALSTGFDFLSSAAIATAVFGTLSGQIERITDFFDGLSALMRAMIPITGTVWAMGGNVSTANVGTASLYAMLAAMEWLCSSAVMPVCCIMAFSAICASFSEGGILGGFSNGVKRVYSFFIGILMTVLVFVLGIQTSVAGAADTVTARSAKLLSSTVIPGVGGAVGETFRTVAGSVAYIKSVVGVGGTVLVLALTLPTVISLLMSRAVFVICAALADALGCKREGKLLSEIGGIYGFLVGAAAICSVSFIIAFGIFIKCTVALE